MNLQYYLPADVPARLRGAFLENFDKTTGGSGRLMLFAGDQKVEHLNDDFYGEGIPAEDNDPEHLFRIASRARIGVFATQYGLIARYGRDYPKIPYLVKLNAKTNLVPYTDKDPYSRQWLGLPEVLELRENGLDIRGVGYTVYLGGEHEHDMFTEAARLVHEAHRHGLLAVLWLYPKGPYVKDEHDPHLIAGAAGVAACLGADFVKLKVPYEKGAFKPELLHEATQAAGRTGVLCEGGSRIDEAAFLRQLHEQIHLGHARGNGTGRNIHQRPLEEAIRMADAIYAVTVEGKSVEEAMKILQETKG